ncbi:MAG: HAMP domain-containing sensor histidine kinase [Bacteriovorax sp.]|jgi:signal transduction histidine kinase
MSQNQKGNEDSFNLTKDNRQRDGQISFTWQEHAYERLKVLYGIGKILTSNDNIEKTFPETLSLCARTFPFLTAILMEGRGEKLNSIVWNSENSTDEQINSAINNAKESFIFLTNASASRSHDLRMADIQSEQLDGIYIGEKTESIIKENYCVIPLVIDQLPAFGILQLEGSIRLEENDLEFIGALADLIAISVDRYHKTKFEQNLRKKEARASSSKLSRSQKHVLDLETERDLREKFVSLLTHDLRTPLTAIKMSAQLIQKHNEDSKAVELYAQRINNSVDRADRMISDLLDANRIRSGEKLPLKIEYIELTELVKKTLNELTIAHGDRFTLKADKLIQGYWDPKGIRRILENLCNNAIKYGSLDHKISIVVEMKAKNVVIEVKNFGNVITHENQKYLFQQFHRGRETIVKGWGIGLTLVRGVALAHGGSVKVSSEVETGTIFTVKLPVDSRPFSD